MLTLFFYTFQWPAPPKSLPGVASSNDVKVYVEWIVFQFCCMSPEYHFKHVGTVLRKVLWIIEQEEELRPQIWTWEEEGQPEKKNLQPHDCKK